MVDHGDDGPGPLESRLAAAYGPSTIVVRGALQAVLAAQLPELRRRAWSEAGLLDGCSGAQGGPASSPEVAPEMDQHPRSGAGSPPAADIPGAAGSGPAPGGGPAVDPVPLVVALVYQVLGRSAPPTERAITRLADQQQWLGSGGARPGATVGGLGRHAVELVTATRRVLHDAVRTVAIGSEVAPQVAQALALLVDAVADAAMAALVGQLDRQLAVDRVTPDPDAAPHVPQLHDPPTGLAARALFADRLRQVARRARRRPATAQPTVLFARLVRPTHPAAGELSPEQWGMLVAVLARRLAGAVRPEDTVARLGADELAVLCEEAPSRQWAVSLAWRVLAVLQAPVVDQRGAVAVGASAGVAVGDHPGWDPDALLAAADHALFRAEQLGPGQVVTAWQEEPATPG